MACSMTGFGQASAEHGEFAISIAIRSVNHRSLEIKLKLPSEAATHESRIRRAIRAAVRRGSLHVAVRLESRGAAAVRIDWHLVEARLEALRQIGELCGMDARPDPNTLIDLPGVFLTGLAKIESGSLEKLIDEGLGRALDQLNRTRSEEGLALVQDIGGHASAIYSEVEKLSNAVPAAVDASRERLRRRLSELLGADDVDPQRLAHEVAILASRSDVSEGLQRLRTHVKAVRACLEDGGEIGKRIDFLAQEMNREANTLLSKAQPLGASALQVTAGGIRIRAAIEKIREQAMNLE